MRELAKEAQRWTGKLTVLNNALRILLSGVRSLLCSMALVALFAVTPCSAQTQAVSSPEFSPIASLMQDQVTAGVPSIAIAAARRGRIVWEHAEGMSDVEKKRAATINTPYYLASISKTITATALMELAEQKKLDLDRPANDYLKTVRVTSPMWDVSQATVRRFANHTAGFSTYDRACRLDDRTCDPSTSTAIRKYGIVIRPPGEAFDYSNLGYGLLGEIVANVTRENLDVALRHLVFSPLGMSTCSLGTSSPIDQRRAARYALSSRTLLRTPATISTTPAASSVYCSVHDLLLFGMFHLKDHLRFQNAILPDKAIDQMQAPSLNRHQQQQYGLGWWIQNDLHGFQGMLAQGGTNDATAYLQLIPSEDIAVAVLCNTGTDGRKIVDEALAALLPKYRENLPHADNTPPSPPEPAPAQVVPTISGNWSGFIQTYAGKVPLIVQIDKTGEVVAKLGPAPEVRKSDARVRSDFVRWTMPGSLGVEGEPFDLTIRLRLRRGLLVGAAETSPLPSNRDGFRTYYWVQLESK